MKLEWIEADKPTGRAKCKWPKAYYRGQLVAFLQPIDGQGYKARTAEQVELSVWVYDYSEKGISDRKGRKLPQRFVGLSAAKDGVVTCLKANRKYLPS